ncbi:MAG: methyltransferase domain-containing protein [Candidatus Microbacterium stercoravium]
MTIDLARSFASGARAYEMYRPPYPAALFDDIRRIAGAGWQRRVLDIGAGTGRAALELARRGARIDAVEPSDDMLSVLTGRLADEGLTSRVTVRKGTFEDIAVGSAYGAVVAAQSFHWTDRSTRWSRLASLLSSDARAFLFWNAWALYPEHHDLRGIARVYAAIAPELPADLPRELGSRMWADEEIDAHPDVRLETRKTYTWTHHMPVSEYIGLLRTVSQYAVAPEALRRRLFEALAPVVGDTVRLTGTTLLLVVAPA